MRPYSACKALIIGVSCYADPQHDLSHARSDAEALAALLGKEFGFDQIWALYDKDATRQNITRFFEHDLQDLGEDDGLVIFFAGHGITAISAIGDERGFLVPHDGDPNRPYANLSLTTIRDDYLPMIPAKHVLLIVDACYSGLALRDITTNSQKQLIDDVFVAEMTRRDRKVRQVLAAGMKNQQVLDGGLFGRSVFTGRLIEVLREASPYITADHLGAHVRERVARDCLDRKHRQTPQYGYLFGSDGSFVFHRSQLDIHNSPPRPVQVVTVARGHLDSGRFAAARSVIEMALKEAPLLHELREFAREIDIAEAKQAQVTSAEVQQKAEEQVGKFISDADRHEKEGNLVLAISCLEEAVRLSPDPAAAAMLTRLQSHAQSGKSVADKLQAIFGRARELESLDPEAAVVAYREALQAYPGNRKAVEGLVRCERKAEARRLHRSIGSRLDACSIERKQLLRAVADIKKEIQQYQELAMDREADVARSELDHRTARSRRLAQMLVFLSLLQEVTVRAESLDNVRESIRNSTKAYAIAQHFLFLPDSEVLDIVTMFWPELIHAKDSLGVWGDEARTALANAEAALQRALHEHELAIEIERQRCKQLNDDLKREYEQRRRQLMDEMTRRLAKAKDKWAKLPWYQKMFAPEPGISKLRRLPQPEYVTPRTSTSPSRKQFLSIPPVPDDCLRAFGRRVFTLLPSPLLKVLDTDAVSRRIHELTTILHLYGLYMGYGGGAFKGIGSDLIWPDLDDTNEVPHSADEQR